MHFRCSAALDHIHFLHASLFSHSVPRSLCVPLIFPLLHLSLQDARLIKGFKQADGDRQKFLECCKSILQVCGIQVCARTLSHTHRRSLKDSYSHKIFAHLNVIIWSLNIHTVSSLFMSVCISRYLCIHACWQEHKHTKTHAHFNKIIGKGFTQIRQSKVCRVQKEERCRKDLCRPFSTKALEIVR